MYKDALHDKKTKKIAQFPDLNLVFQQRCFQGCQMERIPELGLRNDITHKLTLLSL